jgi:Xaa-Pro aminopeptidase
MARQAASAGHDPAVAAAAALQQDDAMQAILTDEAARMAAMFAAEARALALLDRIEELGLVTPGKTERDVELEIRALAAAEFGITRDWHKRIVRAGANTLAIAAENPPVLTIAEDDVVFLDLGPVLGETEADVGRSYALGIDPEKHRLCADLPILFEMVQAHYLATPDISGAELFAYTCAAAEARGWLFGGAIAGHIVAEFPHARLPGDKDHHRVNPLNATRMRDPDANGQARHWILEIHLVSRDRNFGGFYERLLEPAPAA